MANQTDSFGDPVTDTPYPDTDLDAQIAAAEATLADLKARKAAGAKQHYPKMRYHATKAPVTVADAAEEAEKSGEGYTLDGPPSVDGETPNATQHTREDENQRRDLPASMAVDQDARTGKAPIDAVLGDGPDVVVVDAADAVKLKKGK